MRHVATAVVPAILASGACAAFVGVQEVRYADDAGATGEDGGGDDHAETGSPGFRCLPSLGDSGCARALKECSEHTIARSEGYAVSSIALDILYVYWTGNSDGGARMMRVPKAGGATELVAATNEPMTAATTDGQNVYFVAGQVPGPVFSVSKSAIPCDGGCAPVRVGDRTAEALAVLGPEELLLAGPEIGVVSRQGGAWAFQSISSGGNGASATADESRAFYSDEGKKDARLIQKYDPAHGLTSLFADLLPASSGRGARLVVDCDSVWAVQDSDYVARYDKLDGALVGQGAYSLYTTDVAVDGTFLYVAAGANGVSRYERSNPGAGAKPLFQAPAAAVRVDETAVYVGDETGAVHAILK
jgi:hypothetical protein